MCINLGNCKAIVAKKNNTICELTQDHIPVHFFTLIEFLEKKR